MPRQSNAPEIACSLTDEEFQARRAAAREALLPHILETKELECGLKLTFPDNDTLRSNVESFVCLERQCCGFLTFAVTPPEVGLTVTIKGPPEAQATLDLLATAVASP